MKTIKNEKLLTEHELSDLLIEIAIERGLSIPQTEDEVRSFEAEYANEIYQANSKIPSLEEVLALAQELKTSKTPILVAEKISPVDEGFQMAARNGKSISSETHDKMDEALKRAKEKHNSE